MKLLDNVLAERHVRGVFVNHPQRVAVSGDFTFRAVLRLGIFEDERLDALSRGHYSLEPGAGLGRLDGGNRLKLP